jgi:hypothetical protein
MEPVASIYAEDNLKIEEADSSETLVVMHMTTQRHKPVNQQNKLRGLSPQVRTILVNQYIKCYRHMILRLRSSRQVIYGLCKFSSTACFVFHIRAHLFGWA